MFNRRNYHGFALGNAFRCVEIALSSVTCQTPRENDVEVIKHVASCMLKLNVL